MSDTAGMTMVNGEPYPPTPTEWEARESPSLGDNILDFESLVDVNWTDTPCYSQTSYGQSFSEDTVNQPSVVQSIESGSSSNDSTYPNHVDQPPYYAMGSAQADGESLTKTDIGHTVVSRVAHGGRVDIYSSSSGSHSADSQEQSSQSTDTGQAGRRHAAGRYECTFAKCSVVKERQCELTKHIKTVHGDKIHKCSTCHKRFALKKDLKRHLQIHTKSAATPESSGDVSSSFRAISPVSCCSSDRKRVDSPSWAQDQSVDSKRSRIAGLSLRHDSPMEAAAATLNAEFSVPPIRSSRARDVSAQSVSIVSSGAALSSTRQHIDDLRTQLDRQPSKHTLCSKQLHLPQELEFGAVCNDTIIVASRDLLATLSSRYNPDSQLKLRMPAGPPDQRRKLLSELQNSVANYAKRPMTSVVFVGIDPQSHRTSVVEERRSSKMLSRLVEPCSSADNEGIASRAWDTLNEFLQSVLDEHQSDFARNCRVCWTRSAAD